MAGTSLTGIFAPGAPALAETLRTLVVNPQRAVAPGEVIRTEFAFSNLGGAPATGVRVRFSLPQGVTHVAGEDAVDERPLADGEGFVDAGGADVGDLDPGSQRKVACSVRVHDTIEDGTELVFQAALVTAETPLVASNIERLVVRSRPVLQSAQTLLTLTAPDSPKPENVATVRATVVNTGSSSARDVVAMLPVPEHTRFVPRSARVAGRLLAGVDGEAFDYDAGTIVAERLAPGQSIVVEYQVVIEAPLPDGTRIKAIGTVGSRECAEFDLASSEIVVSSPVDFANDESVLRLFCDDIVTPGMRIPIALRATNAGTGDADHVAIAFDLPRGLVFAPGSAHVDGQPVGDDAVAATTFSVGSLAAGRTVEVGFAATTAVPEGDDDALPVSATLRWKGGSRAFARTLHVRVSPRFNRARNYIEADRGIAHAREDVRFTVHVYNDGTAPERDVRLRVIPGAYLENVRISESPDEPMSYAGPLDLGIVQPHVERTFTALAQIASPVPDRSQLALGAVLEHEGGSIDVGTATVIVRSRPQIARESVAWELASGEALRPQKSIDLIVRFVNEGSDVLRDARLALQLPPDLAIERAIEARRERDGLAFGDVPAHATHEARITLRLLHPVRPVARLTLEGWLHGKSISPVQMTPLDVPTYSESTFDSAAIHVAPTESVNAGDRVLYEMALRNDGDGPANRLLVRVVPTNLAVYVPGSTTLNGMPIADDAGASQLWSQRGLALADVTPGIDLRVRWEMIVMSPLAAGTPIDARAVLEWDEGKTLAIAAPTLKVLAQPSLGETSAGTPISIARTFPSSMPVYDAAAPVEEPKTELPPLRTTTPAALDDVIARAQAALDLSQVPAGAAATVAESGPVAHLDLSHDALTQRLAMLDKADAGGLIRHLFAIRALTLAGDAVSGPLDKFFVRLRMPRLTVTAKDLEDRESREALLDLVAATIANPPVADSAPVGDAVRLQGPLDLDELRALHAQLEPAALGEVTPWILGANLMGTTIVREGSQSDTLGRYRDELRGVLDRLSELPMPEFHRVLTSSVNRTLDEALAATIDALRAAAHLAS
jgi:uncharacterized repeat protein (TIGR01451 family)